MWVGFLLELVDLVVNRCLVDLVDLVGHVVLEAIVVLMALAARGDMVQDSRMQWVWA